MITFRRATISDTKAINDIYEKIHEGEDAGKTTIGWIRGVYPTIKTAEEGIALGDMFIEEKDGVIVAAGRINKDQVHPAYDLTEWTIPADPDNVMVLHTLVVDPDAPPRSGIGWAFLEFYEDYAREHGCTCLRVDTNARNSRARAMYKKMGYNEASIIPTVFNDIPGVNLVCMEKGL